MREITEQVRPSRALFLEHPFGLTFGGIGESELQRRVLLDTLAASEAILTPGSIVDLPYHWSRDELRQRQLRKEAH